MKDSIKALLRDAVGSLRDLLPIILVIGVFQLFVIRQPVEGLVSLLTGALGKNGNAVSKTDARFLSNVTFSYNLDAFFPGAPERTMLQLSVGNLFDRKPDLLQFTSTDYGTSELLGRTYTMTPQGNW